MKLRFYLDLWPGLNPERYQLMATTQPIEKIAGTRRIAFDVTIPDSLMFQVDGVASEVSRVELIGDKE